MLWKIILVALLLKIYLMRDANQREKKEETLDLVLVGYNAFMIILLALIWKMTMILISKRLDIWHCA